MSAKSFQVQFSASARTSALDQVHHLSKSLSRAGAEFVSRGTKRWPSLAIERDRYLVDEQRREAVVLAIPRDDQDIRELLYRHLLTG